MGYHVLVMSVSFHLFRSSLFVSLRAQETLAQRPLFFASKKIVFKITKLNYSRSEKRGKCFIFFIIFTIYTYLDPSTGRDKKWKIPFRNSRTSKQYFHFVHFHCFAGRLRSLSPSPTANGILCEWKSMKQFFKRSFLVLGFDVDAWSLIFGHIRDALR